MPDEPQPRTARPGDWPAIEALLVAQALPTAGAQQHLATFVVADAQSTIVGAAGMEIYGDVGLLRSVVIDGAMQRRGFGKLLVNAVLGQARERGVRSAYLLTTTAAEYFTRIGFSPAQRDTAPPALQASEEFQGACPASATLMVLRLGAHSSTARPPSLQIFPVRRSGCRPA